MNVFNPHFDGIIWKSNNHRLFSICVRGKLGERNQVIDMSSKTQRFQIPHVWRALSQSYFFSWRISVDPLRQTPLSHNLQKCYSPGHALYTYCFCFCTCMCSSFAVSLSLFIATCDSLQKEYKKNRFLIRCSKFTGNRNYQYRILYRHAYRPALTSKWTFLVWNGIVQI